MLLKALRLLGTKFSSQLSLQQLKLFLTKYYAIIVLVINILLKSTILHTSLKKLEHLIKQVKNASKTLNIPNLNSQIQTIKTQSQCNIELIPSSNISDRQTWLQNAHII